MSTATDNMLDKLAEAEIGRKGSSLVFVSTEGFVRAVFARTYDQHEAFEYARRLVQKRGRQVLVEGAAGVLWDSQEDD